MESYRQLKVWQLGMELTKEVYLLTQKFPKHEVYGLTSQMRRSVVSIPANLAEGHAKNSTKDYLRHISISQGSLAETETHLLLAESLGYGKPEEINRLMNLCTNERKMLSGLRRSLQDHFKKFHPRSLTPDP